VIVRSDDYWKLFLLPQLPTLSGRQVVNAFAKDGWQKVRQSGSHMILTKPGHMATLSVLDHKEIA